MAKEHINGSALRARALETVAELYDIKAQHERTYPPEIQAVLILSGPGTYLKPLKEYQVGTKDWARWMDHDRIRAGNAIAWDVTRRKLQQENAELLASYNLLIGLPPEKLVTPDVMSRLGPILVYSGIPEENRDFREAMKSPHWKVPQEKIVVIDDVVEPDGKTRPIRHTGDQISSLFQAIRDPESPLHGMTHIAVVTDIQDYARVPFYIQRHLHEHIAQERNPVTFYLYGVKNREVAEDQYLGVELNKLVEYATKGDLATTPAGIIPRQRKG